MKEKNKSKKKKKIIIIILTIIVILILGGILGFKIWKDSRNKIEEPKEEPKQEEMVFNLEEEKQVQIYNGTERPIAVMIDNHTDAWPQAGLNKTYMVYEIIVEGGETRLMALFKGADVDKIGPVRSSRHYFLDYAMENNSIYTHYGWSPQAQSDISTYKINNINGINYGYSSSTFWRVKDKNQPHNAFTSTSAILSMAKDAKYETTSDKTSVLNYVTDEVELTDGVVANKVTIPHSTSQTVKYEYDSETKRYTRYARNKLQKDYSTGEAVTTKNIIIEFIDNYTLQDSENKGRQGLSNIGTFNGYYITNGKATKIKCTKSSRSGKTEYKDLEGNIIKVNDGNTWVNICPTDANVNIE